MSYQKKRQQSRLSVKMCALLLGLCLAVGMGAGIVSAEESVDTHKLLNGSFEDGPAFTKDYNQPDQSEVPYWNTTAFEGKIELLKKNKGTYFPNVTLEPTDGTYAAELNADEESTLYQVVKTTPSSIYEWGLDHGARNGTDTMALVIGPAQSVDPSKPNKTGRDQFMQMVDWLIKQKMTKIKTSAGLGEHLVVYSKKFAADGTFEDNAGNNPFSLTPSTIYTEEWHIWIMASSSATSGTNPWNSYGSNAEGSAGSSDGSGSTDVDKEKYYLYTVPEGQPETLFGFVSVGYVDSPTTADKAKTYGNFLDNINFQLYHPLSGSTTAHGSAVVGGSDGTIGGQGPTKGHEITVDSKYTTYVTDGQTLKIQAVVKQADAVDGCEFVGVYYTSRDEDGNPVTELLQLAENEADDSAAEEEKAGKWVKSTSADGDIIYTYHLGGLTSPTGLHFVFIKSPTITYDPNGGKPYCVGQTGSDELENVYSFKPNSADSFTPPYVSHTAEGQNGGWKFMGWKLTGDTVNKIPEDIVPVNADQLGKLLLPAEHTVACDYNLAGVNGDQKAQYFKIYNGDVTLSEKTDTENDKVTGVTWTGSEGQETYANVHRGLTLVAQWRWQQAFIPQVNDGDDYVNSDEGGTVEITSVDASDENYDDAYNANGGKAYYAETNEIITARATAGDGFAFRGWYDEEGNLITTNATYSYTETRESVKTCYARFSKIVTQTYIRQVKNGEIWENTTDDAVGTLGRYSYTDAVGTPASSTATAGDGYTFVGWYDSNGNMVGLPMLINGGATISYTTTEDATYYARFCVLNDVKIEYTVTYDLNGGSGTISDPQTYYRSADDSTKSTIHVTDAVPTRENYLFDGWELVGSADAVGASINVDNYWNNIPVVGDISDGSGEFKLKAKWKEQTVTISYVAKQGGSVSCDSETLEVFSGIAEGSTATADEGYAFTGWYDNEDCTGTPVSTHAEFKPARNTNATYYARFDRTVSGAAVTASGGTKVYDGQPFAVSAEVTGAEDYTVYYKVSEGEWTTDAPSVTNVSDGTVTVSVKATRPGYVDLTCSDVTIAITPRPITITTDSASKVYDGEALTKNSYTYTQTTEEAGLAPGQSIDITVTGSQTKIGTSDNEVSAVMKDAEGKVVTGNYKITYVKGTLTVTGAEGITVTKIPAQTSVTAGGTITWTVTVRNLGNAEAKGLILTDTLEGAVVTAPDGVDPASFSVPAGGQVVFTVTYKNARAGTYTNHVEVSQPEYSSDGGNWSKKIAEDDSKVVTVRDPYDPDDPHVPLGSPGKPVLNTEDHYSYIIGYKDGTLQPYGTITRGEVATIFFRLLTDETREEYWSQTNNYSDCNSQLWCNNAISTLSNMGIIDGFADGTFRPYAKITRAQFAKIAVGFFETTREDYEGFFTDVSIGAWYTEYVEAAARVGLIQGFEDGAFRPNSNITRAQACVIVNRALNRKPDKEHLLDKDGMLTWVDNNPGDWFYADLQEATNSHDYIWLTEDQEMIEEWTAKLPQRDWAALEHAWSTAHSAPGGQVTR